MELEKRIYPTKLEIRTDPETKDRYIDGLIKVDSPSVDLGGFIEIIKPGAFDSILKDDIRGLINHDPNLIIGRTKANTMQVRVTGEGHLSYSIKLPNTSIASDYAESIQRGDIDGTSFAFFVDKQNWREEGDNPVIREIISFREMRDISPVVYPAYPDNTAGLALRSLYESQKTEIKTEPSALGDLRRKQRLTEIENGLDLRG